MFTDYIIFAATNLSWTQDWFDWNSSLTLCRDIYGTDLASFHNTDNINSYLSLINSTNNNNNIENRDCWIGLIDKTGNNINYTWTDGTPFDFSYWHANAPNNFNNNMTQSESCVRFTRMSFEDTTNTYNYNYNYSLSLNSTSGAKWDDFSCNGGYSTQYENSVATCAVCNVRNDNSNPITTTTPTIAITSTSTTTDSGAVFTSSNSNSNFITTTTTTAEMSTDTNMEPNITTTSMFCTILHSCCFFWFEKKQQLLGWRTVYIEKEKFNLFVLISTQTKVDCWRILFFYSDNYTVT